MEKELIVNQIYIQGLQFKMKSESPEPIGGGRGFKMKSRFWVFRRSFQEKGEIGYTCNGEISVFRCLYI